MADFYEICTEFFSNFDEISAAAFYRELFPFGELQGRNESKNFKYNAIACEICKTKKGYKTRRFTVGNELEHLDELLKSENFVVMAPLSYVGKSRTAKNARYLYALTFDLDGIKGKQGLTDLFFQMQNEFLPYPTYAANSGTGLHLYYVFDSPVPMFPSVTAPLEKLKNVLTQKIWNRYVTKFYEERDIQYEPIWQPFRIVGGVTKDFPKTGRRVRCWQTGKPTSLEELNRFVPEEYRIPKNAIQYKPTMTLEQAKEKYPDWYDSRILKKGGKKYWTVKPALYEWWLDKLRNQTRVGHRYYCIMCLAIYAKKCGIGFDRLKADALSLLQQFDEMTTENDNHFTRQDIKDGLKAYRDEFCTMPINSIVHFSGILIEKNKRRKKPLNRKNGDAFKAARAIQDIQDPDGNWRNKDGRPSYKEAVFKVLDSKPEITAAEFCELTDVSRAVFFKYKKLYRPGWQDEGKTPDELHREAVMRELRENYSLPVIAFDTDEEGHIIDSPMTRRSMENLRKMREEKK